MSAFREESAETKELLRLLLRESSPNGPDLLWQIDRQNLLIDPSQRMADFFDTSVDQLDHAPILSLLAGGYENESNWHAGVVKFSQSLEVGKPFTDLLLPVNIKEEEKWLEISAIPKRSPDGTWLGFIGVASDVTAARETSDRINKMAHYDSVSGLPNKQFMEEALSTLITQNSNIDQKITIGAIVTSRSYLTKSGYGYGQAAVLRSKIGRELPPVLDSTSAKFVGEVYPDEFIVLWDGLPTSKREALEFSKVIGGAGADEFGDEVHVWIGWANFPQDGLTASTLIETALDRAYQAQGADDSYDGGRRHIRARGSTNIAVSSDIPLQGAANIVLLHGPAALAGVDALLTEHEARLHNGPPEPVDADQLESLRQLHTVLGDLISLAERGRPTETELGIIARLSNKVFSFSRETGEICVAGMKPLLASIPTAIGTMLLIQAICSPATAAIMAPGAALAVMAGYFGLEIGQKKRD